MRPPEHERSRPGTTQDGSNAQMTAPATLDAREATAAIAVVARTFSADQIRTVAVLVEDGLFPGVTR